MRAAKKEGSLRRPKFTFGWFILKRCDTTQASRRELIRQSLFVNFRAYSCFLNGNSHFVNTLCFNRAHSLWIRSLSQELIRLNTLCSKELIQLNTLCSNTCGICGICGMSGNVAYVAYVSYVACVAYVANVAYVACLAYVAYVACLAYVAHFNDLACQFQSKIPMGCVREM